MNKKQWLGLGLVAVAAIGLAACGNRASKSDNKDAKTNLNTLQTLSKLLLAITN